VFLSGVGRPADADELSAGDLYSFCTSNDQMASSACRFYVLGVVQGVGLGDGSTMDASGKQMVERKKTIFCIPDDMSQTQMVNLVRDLLGLDFKRYPEDRKLAAAGMVAGIMHTKFPCSPR
jgi:Rap1a immunity proteins